MAQSGQRILHAGAAAVRVRQIRWIDLDLDRVCSRWHHRLAITAIEDEILAAQLEHVGVGAAIADPLESI
jgi:hypothetical protein